MLVTCFLQTARSCRNKPAARDPVHHATYARMVLLARAMRRLILAETQCPRIGMMLPGSVAGLGTALGTLWADKTLVPLNCLLPPAELEHIVTDAEIDRIIATRHFAKQLDPLPVRTVYLEDVSLKRRCLLESFRRPPPPPPAAEDTPAAIVYTSGSTGRPRGVCLTHGNLLSNATSASRATIT